MAKGVGTLKIDSRAIFAALEEDMRKDCERLVKEALNTSTYRNQTGNLASSYGAAVYKDGVFLENTLATYDFSPTKTKKWYARSNIGGQGEMRNYFRNYKPRGKGFTIVLVAAMPYSEVLEKGSAGLHQKYKVISGAYSLLQDLADKYSGKRGYKQYKWGQGVRATIKPIND